MNDLRWVVLAITTVVTILFASITFSQRSEEMVSLKMVSAGLEQCPREPGHYNNIWVKDCLAYTKQLIDREREQDK